MRTLDRALVRLAEPDRRQVDLIEMHFFGGLNDEEITELGGPERAP